MWTFILVFAMGVQDSRAGIKAGWAFLKLPNLPARGACGDEQWRPKADQRTRIDSRTENSYMENIGKSEPFCCDLIKMVESDP